MTPRLYQAELHRQVGGPLSLNVACAAHPKSTRLDLNQGPVPYQGTALPLSYEWMVGRVGGRRRWNLGGRLGHVTSANAPAPRAWRGVDPTTRFGVKMLQTIHLSKNVNARSRIRTSGLLRVMQAIYR